MRTAIFAAALMVSASWQAQAHEWYSNQRNPVTGASCCGKADCVPIPQGDVTYHKNGITFRYPLDGNHYTIPLDQVLPSQDHQNHACVWGKNQIGEGPRLCFFAGGGV